MEVGIGPPTVRGPLQTPSPAETWITSLPPVFAGGARNRWIILLCGLGKAWSGRSIYCAFHSVVSWNRSTDRSSLMARRPNPARPVQ